MSFLTLFANSFLFLIYFNLELWPSENFQTLHLTSYECSREEIHQLLILLFFVCYFLRGATARRWLLTKRIFIGLMLTVPIAFQLRRLLLFLLVAALCLVILEEFKQVLHMLLVLLLLLSLAR